MRNKEQALAWQKAIEACMEDVKNHFAGIEQCIEFGVYMQPENHFVSYIFATDAQLEAAQQSGLTEKLNSYHREQLRKHHYPIQRIKDCCFASQEECDAKHGRNRYYYYASFEEQLYIGDEGKIHVYSWDGRQEATLVGLYSVRELYLDHFGN